MAGESTEEQRTRAMQRQAETLQRLHRQSSETSEIVARTHHLIEDVRRDLSGAAHRADRRTADPETEVPVNECHQVRENTARARLLEWEASDLALTIPRGSATPRAEFAYLLYDLVLHADVLGMSTDRLLYHVQYAQNRYTEGA